MKKTLLNLFKNKIFLFLLSWFFFGILLYSPKIIIDSNLDLAVYPLQSYKYFFQGWHDLLYLGINNAAVAGYIFPFGFLYWSFSFILPTVVVQATIVSLFFAIGFIGFIFFAEEELQNKSFFIYIGGIFYLLNTYTMLTLGTNSFFLPYISLPWQLYFLRRSLIGRDKRKYIIGFGLSSLFMSGVNPPLVAINLIALIFYFLHLLFNFKLHQKIKETILSLFSLGALYILFNSFWIFGVVLYYATLSKVAFASVLSEPLSMQNSASSYFNVFRMLSLWSFGGEAGGIPYYNYSSVYSYNPLIIFGLFLIPIISILGLIRLKKEVNKYIFFVALFLFSVPMTVGSYGGLFSHIYEWAYYHLPLFSMFRSSFKISALYIFCLSFFLIIFIKSFTAIRSRIIMSIFVLILIVFNAFPFFTGRLYERSKQISAIPSYYYDAKNFFNNDRSEYRILLLPEQYFASYSWGFTGGNPETMWGKSLVVRQGGSILYPSNKLAAELDSDIFSKQYSKANILMKKLNVKYIVERNDFDWHFYKEISQSPSEVKKALMPYEKVATFGKLDIYKVPDSVRSESIIGNNISFEKISDSYYKIYLHHVRSSELLSFLESYDYGWKLFVDKYSNGNCKLISSSHGQVKCEANISHSLLYELLFLAKKPIFDSQHKPIFDYANSWNIDKKTIIENYPSTYYKVNSDRSIDATLSLYFIPQDYLYIGIFVSLLSIIGSLGYLLFTLWKGKNL